GDVFRYRALAEAIGPRGPFVAIRSIGLESDGPPLRSITEMAARYIEAIEREHPSGPYYLGGWSMGALIAFEMARQLRAKGGEVAALVLIDTGRVPPDAGRHEDYESAPPVALVSQTVFAPETYRALLALRESHVHEAEQTQIEAMLGTMRRIGADESKWS